MTQFSLVRTGNPVDGLCSVSLSNLSLYESAASKWFAHVAIDELREVCFECKDIDALMVEAQKAILDGDRFEETSLYAMAQRIGATAEEWIFWYGSDFDELECVAHLDELLERLREAIARPSCEAYIQYRGSTGGHLCK